MISVVVGSKIRRILLYVCMFVIIVSFVYLFIFFFILRFFFLVYCFLKLIMLLVSTNAAGFVLKCYIASGGTAGTAISIDPVLCVSKDGIDSGGCAQSKC